MKPRKLAKRIQRLERRVAALEAVTVAQTEPLDVTGEPLDVFALLDGCVQSWQHGWDDDEDWSGRGYI